MNGHEIIQVDAFTSKPFGGNPAAVFILDGPADETWMQQVALEMNLSDTAYLYPIDNGYNLRWFTPAAEVKLCGHATLATAYVLYEDGHVPKDLPCRFETLYGELIANYRDQSVEIEFPVDTYSPLDEPGGLADALGCTPTNIVLSGLNYCLIEIDSEEELRSLSPDINALAKIPYLGFAVTAQSESPDLDFVSRFFGPALGINEDPVTGSAHCLLGPYWQEKLGRSDMKAYQASARGGDLSVRVDGDRVTLGGQAVITMRGTLL